MSKSKKSSEPMTRKDGVITGILAGIIAVIIVSAGSSNILMPRSAEAAGAKFCRAYQADSDWRIKMIATKDLKNQWREAEKQNAAIQRARPDEKPPLGDGIPVASYPDSMPDCQVGKITKRGDNQLVNINHIDPAKPSSNWTDKIIVKQEGSAFLIDDVSFPSQGGSLRTALARTIKTPVPEAEMAADQAPAKAEPAAGNSAPRRQQPAPAQAQPEVIHWNTNN